MNRKGWIIVGAVASFLLVLCCACAVAGWAWWSGTRDAPAATVEQYLTAIRDDDTARVRELTCHRAGVATRLMADWTDVVDWEIIGDESYERSAEVTARVTYTIMGITDSQRMVFTLLKEDDQWVVCGLTAAR
ncbi:hypothetical protein [Allorhizocola rhizosphaerae]|uniref:Rv0361 family membrane protein n=1 Tax=Allorhizocola rhizosphaerae TaxID=1872709 RepID=UPI000E3E4305|nr:hypothetical protein [Allorhizocola rhizosphaerae]